MSDNQITIEVDGKSLSAKKGQMLIEVTDANDIYVPRFCYHHKLSVAANCRMCLVEVEKAPKALPACATPVMDGMKVSTRSALAREAQKSIMEFLLINHPLDCPICDQGGECELQDLAMGYGRDVSRYQEKKRVVKDKNIGPLIQTDLTRCIHCTRCVRFGEEISGVRELGATGRGEDMEIGTYIEKSVVSELSGNVIDLCPVGALTSKPFRYSARTWELVQRQAIAPHDAVGSNLYLHVKGDKVMRVVPAENEAINEVWLSDRDRFSYEAIYSEDRLTAPMIKKDGAWQTVDWETALSAVKEHLQAVIKADGTGQIGALASPSSTLEELYLLQKWLRALGAHNIDSRLRQTDFSDQEAAPDFPWLGTEIAELEHADAVLLIGSHLRKDQPILNHRLRKAALGGARVMAVNPVDVEFNYPLAAKAIVSPAEMGTMLAAVLKALIKKSGATVNDPLAGQLDKVSTGEIHEQIAKVLGEADKTVVLIGNTATAHPQFAVLRALAGEIAKAAGATFGYLAEAANSTGAWLAGAVPHRLPGGQKNGSPGLHTAAMLEAKLKAYVLMGVEPELDCSNGALAAEALDQAERVICLTAYRSDAMASYADVLLPISVFAETAGTYINNAGTTQTFTGAVAPVGEARPAWKVLRVLGNYFDLDGFNYQSATDVLDEARQQMGDLKKENPDHWTLPAAIEPSSKDLQRITEVPMNMIDPICRRALALQQTPDIADGGLHLNAALAGEYQLADGESARITQGEESLSLPVVIDKRVPDDCVLLQSPHAVHSHLGSAFGPVTLAKA